MTDQTVCGVQLTNILVRLDSQETRTNRLEAENSTFQSKNHMIIEENKRLKKEIKELRS